MGCACGLFAQIVPSLSVEAVEMESQVRQVSYLLWRQPELSSQNPDNEFLELYRYQARVELRPDIKFIGTHYQLMLKPRLSYDYWWHKVGAAEESGDSQGDIYLNEGMIQFEITPDAFIVYGRENLQWGPSYLRTPSNPFFRDNGQDNPKKEIEGKDFFKVIYLPNDWFTMSIIGLLEPGGMKSETAPIETDFRRQNALKLDLLGVNYNASLILSRQDGGNEFVGGHAQGTVTDAVLIYFDAAVYRGHTALYPRLDSSHPLGGDFVRQYDNNTKQYFIGVTGISYTLENSATLSLEYLYNGIGYNDSEAEAYYFLRQNAADNIHSAFSDLARANLGASLDPGLKLLRRHYLFLQYALNEMGEKLSYTLRWTLNMDDHSDMFTLITEYAYNDYLEFFVIGDINQGSSNSEFTSLLRNDLMLGFEYTF